MTKDITDATFQSAIAEGVSLVDCWAEWCGPCRMLGPVIEELSEEMDGVNFYKLDVDENQVIPGQLGIRSIPTMLITKDGEIVDTLVGFMPKQVIIQAIEKNM